ncbi:MAG: DUF4339 domain-containing protein [Polyangiaceae bacterium]|nr:DUF4339 domain-containing protein [Polyangiaceae bacterium]
MNATEWHWADADGVVAIVDAEELGSMLSSEQLPAYTLVWRPGWARWLHASQAAELAARIPAGKTEPVVEPALEPDRSEPPAPPVDRYAPYKAREAATALVRPGGARASAPPPPPPPPGGGAPPSAASRSSGAAALVGRAAASASAPPPPPPPPPTPPPPPPPPEPHRAPMPTLAEPQDTEGSHTLRPPGAVPPPPRAVPAGIGAAPTVAAALATPLPDLRITERSATPEPAVTGDAESEPPTAPTHDPPAPAAAAAALLVSSAKKPSAPPPPPPVIPAVALPPPAPPPALREAPLPAAPPSVPPPAPQAVQPPPAPAAGPSGAVLLLGAVVVALGMIVAALVISRGGAPQTPVVAPVVAPAAPTTAAPAETAARAPVEAPSAPASPAACALARQSRRLAAEVEPGTVPQLGAGPADANVLVGWLERGRAQGHEVSPATLDHDRRFDERAPRGARAVVPMPATGSRFYVEARGGALGAPRTVAAARRFAIGLHAGGVARSVEDGAPEVLWADVGREITEPRVATTARGHAVAFRRGGMGGSIELGWLEPDGTKRSALAPVRDAGALLGTPVVAASETAALVAFASRPDKSSRWGIRLAVGPAGGAPGSAVAFSLPSGGPGGEALAPALSPLPGGRWLLAWTEGSTGGYQVRAQTLDAGLGVVGPPLTLSQDGANAGQAVAWTQGEHVVVAYLVKSGKKQELWVASVRCGR